MAKKQVNVALIGAQFMGKAHSNGLRQAKMFFDLPVEPVMKVLCAKTKASLEVAEKYGWEESSTDWKKVVERDDIDVVSIATPGNLHHPMAIAAAKAGKHIICEKPLANTRKEAMEMLAAVKKAGVKHMCAYSYRFAPAVQTIKKMISSGKLGEIYHVRAAYQQDWIVDPDFPMVWRLDKKTAGAGALGDIGAHIIDMCQFLVGEIDEVCGSMRTFIKKRPVAESSAGISKTDSHKKGKGKMGTVTVDDAAIFMAHLKGLNTIATFEATRFATGQRNKNAIEVYGSKGSVTWNQEDMNFFHYYNAGDDEQAQGFRRIHATDGGHPFADAWWPTGHIIGYEHLFAHEMVSFFSNLNKKAAPYPTFEDGCQVQKVLDAVERASKSRKWEKVK